MASAKRHHLEIEAYLADVLRRLPAITNPLALRALLPSAGPRRIPSTYCNSAGPNQPKPPSAAGASGANSGTRIDTACRRMLNGEAVPNKEKLFSIFEPHTQLYKRGKAGEPVQFGRMTLVYEDAAGFITHSYVLGRDELERDTIIPQTKIVKKLLKGKLKESRSILGVTRPRISATWPP